MKNYGAWCRAALALLLALLVAGCGASSYNASTKDMAGDLYYDTNAASNDSWNAESSTPYDPAPQEPGYGGVDSDALDPMNAALPEGVKMIYSASLTLETTEFDQAVQQLSQLVQDCGGWVESSQLYNYNSYREAVYTFRVPAEQFSPFCQQAGELCTLRDIRRSGEDVSERYYDSESRLATQRTKLTRLQELLAKAENMEDIITLESAISETELAIEQLTGTLRHYDSLVGYSTVNVELREVYKVTAAEEPAIGFWAKLGAAFRAGTGYFVDDLQDLALGFARGWAGWLIFFAVAAAVILLLRRSFRRRRERRGQEPQAPRPSRRKAKAAPAQPAETQASAQPEEKE